MIIFHTGWATQGNYYHPSTLSLFLELLNGTKIAEFLFLFSVLSGDANQYGQLQPEESGLRDLRISCLVRVKQSWDLSKRDVPRETTKWLYIVTGVIYNRLKY